MVLFQADWMSMPLFSKGSRTFSCPFYTSCSTHLSYCCFVRSPDFLVEKQKLGWSQVRFQQTADVSLSKVPKCLDSQSRAPFSLFHHSAYLCSACIVYVTNSLKMVIYLWGFKFLFYLWSVFLFLHLFLTSGREVNPFDIKISDKYKKKHVVLKADLNLLNENSYVDPVLILLGFSSDWKTAVDGRTSIKDIILWGVAFW